MDIPRAGAEMKEFFRSVVPDDPRVTVRPMFGNHAAFVNGNMFMGLYGEDLFVRLSDQDRQKLLENRDASVFEPMKGRPMKDYILIPRGWRDQRGNVRLWVNRSLEFASKLPPKKAKK